MAFKFYLFDGKLLLTFFILWGTFFFHLWLMAVNIHRYYDVPGVLPYVPRYRRIPISGVYDRLCISTAAISALLVKVNGSIFCLQQLRGCKQLLCAAPSLILNEIFIFLYHGDEWMNTVVPWLVPDAADTVYIVRSHRLLTNASVCLYRNDATAVWLALRFFALVYLSSQFLAPAITVWIRYVLELASTKFF